MTKFQAAVWLIAIILAFSVLSFGITAMINSQALVIGSVNPNLALANQQFALQSNPFYYVQRCEGKGNAMRWLNNHEIWCGDLSLNKDAQDQCNNVTGCEWVNASLLGNFTIIDARCSGYVNMTFYNMQNETKSTYCSAAAMQTREMCEVFKCNWFNNTNQFTEPRTINSEYSTATVWQTVSWIATFQIDIGWGYWNIVITFIFYLLMVGLLASMYFMFVPW